MGTTKTSEFTGFGAMGITQPYEFIGFGAMDVTKPYEFIGFGAMEVTKPCEFIGPGPGWVSIVLTDLTLSFTHQETRLPLLRSNFGSSHKCSFRRRRVPQNARC